MQDVAWTSKSATPASIVLVGAAGFGAVHLRNILLHESDGRVRLVGIVDPLLKASPPPADSPNPLPDVPLFDTLPDAFAELGKVDIAVIATPIHLHAPIAIQAISGGADVLLEKPPFANLASFQSVRSLAQQHDRAVQIGFQSLGSEVLRLFREDHWNIGKVQSVRATGCWLRRKVYYGRTKWAGKRSIGEIDVMDGVACNSLAHAMVTALHIAGVHTAEQVGTVEVEAYRANPIDADDTISLRITSPGLPTVCAGLTLCAAEQTMPVVEVVGDKGALRFSYVTDEVAVRGEDGTWGEMKKYGRTDLLDDLIAHRGASTSSMSQTANGTANGNSHEGLMASLEKTGCFMRVLEAIRLSGEPHHIARKYVTWKDEGVEAHPVVEDVERWIEESTSKGLLFSEVGCPWAWTKKDASIYTGRLGKTPLFELLEGNGTHPTSSPRPFLHPIRTLAGTEITAKRPADHDWHLGMGFALPDVDRCSFWGGGTFILGKGYVLLDNHGKAESTSVRPTSTSVKGDVVEGIEQDVVWTNHRGKEVIQERQTISWAPLPGFPSYILSFATALTATHGPLSIGSPGTNGRENAGYGGWTWRFPACSAVQILGENLEGEGAVHGSLSPWMSWAARWEGRPGAVGDATIVVIPADARTAEDRWIVRCQSYPGIGSAFAWKDRVEVADGETVKRSFRCAVVDGRLDRREVEKVVDELRRSTV